MPAIQRDAVRLPRLVQGAPDGVPVVLLHGWSDSLRSFEPLLEHLPETIRACALTVRGHGDAPKPDGGYDVASLCADVVAFLDEAGIERAVVAGHSMGSILATSLAIDAPERLSGLVLLAAKPTYGDPALEPLYDEVRAFGDDVDPAWVRGFQESTLARPVPDAFLEQVVDESMKMPARVWQALLDPTIRVDRSARLGEIGVPTLLAWGDVDEIATHEDQVALLRALPDARLHVYPGGGHAFHWEEPAVFAADLVTFALHVADR
jgi:pimeloyl-ACP methyl ester carboxylesterase